MALEIAAVPVLTGEASDRFDQLMEESVEQPVNASGRAHKNKRSDFIETSFLVKSTLVGVRHRQKVPD